MATQAMIGNSGSTLVRRALQADGLLCIVCGIVMAVGAGAVAALLGLNNWLVVELVGLGLLVYGAVLFWTTSRRPIDRRLAWLVPLLNCVWVIASAVIIAVGWSALSTEGKWAIGILADVVATLAVVQFYALWRSRP